MSRLAPYTRSLATRAAMRRAAIARSPWTPEKTEQLEKLARAGGLTGQQMADALGYSYGQVTTKLWRLGIQVNGGVLAAAKASWERRRRAVEHEALL